MQAPRLGRSATSSGRSAPPLGMAFPQPGSLDCALGLHRRTCPACRAHPGNCAAYLIDSLASYVLLCHLHRFVPLHVAAESSQRGGSSGCVSWRPSFSQRPSAACEVLALLCWTAHLTSCSAQRHAPPDPPRGIATQSARAAGRRRRKRPSTLAFARQNTAQLHGTDSE